MDETSLIGTNNISLKEIAELISLDTPSLRNLPPIMRERAEWARTALLMPDDYVIRFGRYGDYTIAVYNPEDSLWYDIDGHYHHEAPSCTIYKQIARENDNRKIAHLANEVLIEFGMPVEDIDCYRPRFLTLFFSRPYRDARSHFPNKCAQCGSDSQKCVWHHFDFSLKWEMDTWIKRLSAVSALESPAEWQSAFRNYIQAIKNYYTASVEETILLCPKCHRAAHPRIRKG